MHRSERTYYETRVYLVAGGSPWRRATLDTFDDRQIIPVVLNRDVL